MEDIQAALAKNSEVKQLFDALPPSHQKEYTAWINEAKKPETRAKRLQRMIEMIQAKAKA